MWARNSGGRPIICRSQSQTRSSSSVAAGEVRQLSSGFPVQARNVLLQAYHSGFSITLNHLMVIGAVVAFVGALAAFALVRQSDFIVPTAPPSGPPAQGAQAGTPDDVVPAVHA